MPRIPHNPLTGSASSETGNGQGGGRESVLSINISEKTVSGGYEDRSSFRKNFGAPSTTSAFDTRHPRLSLMTGVQDDVHHHEINKSNQENTNPLNRPTPHISHGPGENVESSEKTTSSASSADFERDEMLKSQMTAGKDNLLLHRHKRYLVFPEGSTFQLGK